MEWNDMLTDAYDRIVQIVEPALTGLTVEDLNWQPRPDCNSMGWLAWHLTRQQDAQLSSLAGEEQLWITQRWFEKFDMPPDARDIGFGHTPEQVAAFKSPDVETHMAHLRAVVERSKKWFNTLTKEELDRKLDEPRFQPLPTVGVRLVSIMDDAVIHGGQIAYVRGLKEGMGWQKH